MELISKYYIEYPIPIRCDLRCGYCFHGEAWELDAAGKFEDKYTHTCPFTPRQFMKWRDKHLADGTDFIYELHGGEPSCSHGVVLEILDTIDKGKFQLQTHGLGDAEFYEALIKRKDKIDRIGFTYHRKALKGNGAVDAKFANNVLSVDRAGIPVYVKELLHPDLKDVILKNKTFWKSMGVEFRIQDFKGRRGCEPIPNTPEDYALIHHEYKHYGSQCACREGRKQVLIRGYDIFAGDVLACWNDPVVVGSVIDDWYNGAYVINRAIDGAIEVTGVGKAYRGSYPGDVWTPENEKSFGNFNKTQLKERKVVMEESVMNFAKGQLEQLPNTLRQINETRGYHLAEAERLRKDAEQVVGAIAAYEAVVDVGEAAAGKIKDELLKAGG
ncbi:MAG: hypothetical protein LBU70_04980 [Chitinispirillales bacterium]|jgi:organic radical activating enzyme|nr:hypothetical protein [Chitinispirillales bacterium]